MEHGDQLSAAAWAWAEGMIGSDVASRRRNLKVGELSEEILDAIRSSEMKEGKMMKALSDFLFGLCFGLGFYVAANVLNFLGQFIHASH